MRAFLKSLHTIDGLVEFDESYQPEDPINFSVGLRMMVGPFGSEGEESFDVTVCTPRCLDVNMGRGEALFGRHYLFVKQFNYKLIRSKLEKYVNACSGKNWSELGEKIGRIAYWEFEDHSVL